MDIKSLWFISKNRVTSYEIIVATQENNDGTLVQYRIEKIIRNRLGIILVAEHTGLTNGLCLEVR